jgi:pilus assembly protein CpaF
MSFFGHARVLRNPKPNLVETPSSRPHSEIDAQTIYQELIDKRPALLDEKLKLHTKIIDEFNLSQLEKLSRDDLIREIRAYVVDYVRAERISLNQKELDIFATEIVDEMIGFGPIEPLLKDPTVNDILINTHKTCYVERFGKLERTRVHFKDESHLLRIVNKIVAGVGRRVDESSPMVDARLPDGSRVNIAIRPISVDGPMVSIRKFSEKPFDLEKLIEVGSIRPQMVELLHAAVQGKISLIISGGTGSGKTTLLNALSNYIPADERLITIEDAAELQLQQPHVGRLETRPLNAEGKGEIRQRELVKNALRMRPDRIIIGECRGEEAFDMLQAMNTGHEGSMTTIHANSPRDAMKRLEQMVAMSGMSMSPGSIRSTIASALRIVIQLQRLPDGKRRAVSISEITGMEGEVIQMQEIYRFVKEHTDEHGIHGSYRATGVRPSFLQELKAYGIEIPGSSFEISQPL